MKVRENYKWYLDQNSDDVKPLMLLPDGGIECPHVQLKSFDSYELSVEWCRVCGAVRTNDTVKDGNFVWSEWHNPKWTGLDKKRTVP